MILVCLFFKWKLIPVFGIWISSDFFFFFFLTEFWILCSCCQVLSITSTHFCRAAQSVCALITQQLHSSTSWPHACLSSMLLLSIHSVQLTVASMHCGSINPQPGWRQVVFQIGRAINYSRASGYYDITINGSESIDHTIVPNTWNEVAVSTVEACFSATAKPCKVASDTWHQS